MFKFPLISFLILILTEFVPLSSMACTNLIVGKDASVNGSTIVSYASDSYGAYGYLFLFPHAKHPKGTMRPIYDYETNNYLGEIPEASETYRVVGLSNEFQLTIVETTFGGREELWEGKDAIMEYGSMMQIALQRSKNAREAIKCMTDLVEKYGYRSEGESFTIADPKEVWIMEMIGKGKEEKGAVWVAVRVPDDCISAHANQSRIRKFPLNDKKNCIYSKDVISFARQKGYFNGKDEDFSFSAAYSPSDFGAQRFCEARVWSFFNKWADMDMKPFLPYAMGMDGEGDYHEMPLFVKPKRPLSCQNVKDMMRDHYEGTEMDITTGLGAGAYQMPYRPTPLTYEVDSVKYFNERPISTQQSSCIYVAEMRSWLPNEVGCVVWFGNDDANMIPLVPIYTTLETQPECFHPSTANAFTFSFRSAYWLQNWVSNMVYYRYIDLFPELRSVRHELEQEYNRQQDLVEKLAMESDNPGKYLANYSMRASGLMMDTWMQLAQKLIVKYNDMCVKKTDESGNYIKTPGGEPDGVSRPGYPDAYRRKIIEENATKYRMP